MKKYLWKTTQILIILAILVQIVFAFRWTIGNWGTIPSFGDTNEYIEMSQSWLLDEYRPVLYPLLIHLARCISETYFAQILFALQTVVSLISLAYCVCSTRKIMIERGLSVCEKLPICLTTLYL